MCAISIDMFDLKKLVKLEKEDMGKITNDLLKKRAEITKKTVADEINSRLEDNEDNFQCVKYIKNHVFVTNDEIKILTSGKLIDITRNNFKSVYLDKCEIVNKYFDNYNTDVYTVISNPKYKQVDKKKLLLNVFPRQKYTYDDEFEKNEEFIKEFKDLLLKVHCDGNEKLFDLLYKSLAHIIKGYKLPAIFFFKGLKGCGKSSLLYVLELLLGEELFKVLKESDYQRFNGSFINKLLVAMDENQKAGYVNDRTYSEIIKNMKTYATSHSIAIEKKGNEVETKDIFCTQFLCGNYNLSEEDERRFLIFSCGSYYVGNTKFWNEFYAKCTNKNIESLYNDLYEQKTDEHFVENIQDIYRALNIECKNDAIHEQKNKNGVYYYLHQMAINNQALDCKRSDFGDEAVAYLKKNFGMFNISKGTRNFIYNDLRDIGIEAQKDGHGIFYYKLSVEELTKILLKNQILNEEDIAVQKLNKEEVQKEVKDGRDETIKALKAENEALKKRLAELEGETWENFGKEPDGQKELLELVEESNKKTCEMKGAQYDSLKDALFN